MAWLPFQKVRESNFCHNLTFHINTIILLYKSRVLITTLKHMKSLNCLENMAPLNNFNSIQQKKCVVKFPTLILPNSDYLSSPGVTKRTSPFLCVTSLMNDLVPCLRIKHIRGSSCSHAQPKWAAFFVLVTTTRTARGWAATTTTAPCRTGTLFWPALDPALGNVQESGPHIFASIKSEKEQEQF